MASALKAPLTPLSVNVCVDMQRLFGAEGPWPTPWLEQRRDVIVHLASRFPERTLFTRFVPPENAEDMPRMWQRSYERWPNATRAKLDSFAPQFARSNYQWAKYNNVLARHGL